MRLQRLTLVIACTAAFLFSAIASTAISYIFGWQTSPSPGLAGWQQVTGLLTLTFSGALAHAFLFGLPAFLAVRQRGTVTLWKCAKFGTFIGIIPLGVLSFLTQFGLESASTDGIPTVINHIPTLFGLWELAQFVALLGFLGFVGGLAFWVTLFITRTLALTNRTNASEANFVSPALALIVAAGVSGAMYYSPKLVEDRTCHNMFRDGRRSIAPEFSIELSVPVTEWVQLRAALARFGTAHHLSVQDYSDSSQAHDGLYVSLCNEAGLNVEASDLRWREANPANRNSVPIGIFLVRNNVTWKQIAHDLVETLERRWPGKLTFQGRNGEVAARP